MTDPLARARLEKLADLLPCPFCGGLPISSYERDGRVIACQQCFARAAPAFHGRADKPSAEERACSNWNRRAILAALGPGEAGAIARLTTALHGELLADSFILVDALTTSNRRIEELTAERDRMRAVAFPETPGFQDIFDRERLGRLVRHVWVKWANRQPSPKPSWTAPYDDLSEPDKEADRMIGENIAQDILGRLLRSWGGDAASLRALETSEAARLRAEGELAKCGREHCMGWDVPGVRRWCTMAVFDVEHLARTEAEARLERMRSALEQIADGKDLPATMGRAFGACKEIARNALAALTNGETEDDVGGG